VEIEEHKLARVPSQQRNTSTHVISKFAIGFRIGHNVNIGHFWIHVSIDCGKAQQGWSSRALIMSQGVVAETLADFVHHLRQMELAASVRYLQSTIDGSHVTTFHF